MKTCRLAVTVVVSFLILAAAPVWAQTSSVTGRVTNEQGSPVVGADVSLVPPPMAPMPAGMTMAPDRTTKTKADGTFALDQVPPGTYVLQVDAPGQSRASQEVTVPVRQALAVSLETLEIPGGERPANVTATGGLVETQQLMDRIKILEQRILDLESSTVLSEPVTRVKRIDIWVDKNGVQYDHETAGAKKAVTYQRERVYRRENINEKLEEALTDAENRNVKIGVSAATVTQLSRRSDGNETTKGHAYELASADLFFTAGLAQNTVFFADIVGLSGAPPDAEIPARSLLNSYTARLVRQNEINLREAWVRTEVFSQKLALIAGRLDLTNYFDHNAAANDETTQFISDALVNNPALGLAVNGAGAAAVFDPKNGFNLKFGVQQSNPNATNLSQSVYSLAEAGYVARPPALGEGNYRLWYRWNNGSDDATKAFGVSLDQKLIPTLTAFGRYGSAQAGTGNDRFYSAGLQIQSGWVFNPLDTWGAGYAQINPAFGGSEKLAEGYYNFRLTERLRLSFHLQRVLDSGGDKPRFGYFLPGIRLQASF
jgi:hypothetical protein